MINTLSHRFKTGWGEESSKVASSFRKTGRGTIHVNHPSLYNENFSPSK
jgi:hypothetical protein